MSDDDLPGQCNAAAERGFRAVLSPHRSLSPTGFVLLMTAVGVVSFIMGMAFLLMGAWPVFGFFGLDAALIYLAFRLNYRSARLREVVTIERGALTLTRVHPSGQRESFQFNPYWVRVILQVGRAGLLDLRLASHGRELSFGRFLTDDQKREFADVLRGALITARGGPRL
ncbi:MAG TPA: DUF2244 domain-containing protein [Hyphomicrobiaceae bacterium]|nr:DUF2244 domain-containing protein [Hyphomicrobiaceae bacterium]